MNGFLFMCQTVLKIVIYYKNALVHVEDIININGIDDIFILISSTSIGHCMFLYSLLFKIKNSKKELHKYKVCTRSTLYIIITTIVIVGMHFH